MRDGMPATASTHAAARPPPAQRTRRRAPRGRVVNAAVAAAGAAVALGAWHRDELDLAAYEGVGYALGVVGLGCMTLLLGYSVRKRFRPLRELGRVSTWFQVHMLLGLLGPVAILYHCGFRLGSTNSNVALACALVVAGSGVVGRVIYTRIHHGLSDERVTVAEMRDGVARARSRISGDPALSGVWRELEALEARVPRPGSGVLAATGTSLLLGHRCRRARARARRGIPRRGDGASELRAAIDGYVRSVRRLGSLAAQERLFALWHVLHLPLCFLLFASAAFHVVAVHMY